MKRKIFKWGTLSLLFMLLCTAAWGYFALYEKEHAELSEKRKNEEWQKACPDIHSLRSGDLIFRHGRGFISNSLAHFSKKDSRYSHAGIITFINGKPYVYHSIGGEENITNKLRRESLTTFCNPDNNHSFGIYRLDLNQMQLREMDSAASAYYKAGLEFDTDFDLATDDKMYCTEFVYKIINGIVHDKNYIPLSEVSGKKYVACDDIYINPHSTKIYSYVY